MNTVAQLRADPSIVDLSHEERIELVAEGASESFQPEAIDDSWRRSLLDFHVDLRSSGPPVRPGCNARYSRKTNPIGRSRRPRSWKRRA